MAACYEELTQLQRDIDTLLSGSARARIVLTAPPAIRGPLNEAFTRRGSSAVSALPYPRTRSRAVGPGQAAARGGWVLVMGYPYGCRHDGLAESWREGSRGWVHDVDVDGRVRCAAADAGCLPGCLFCCRVGREMEQLSSEGGCHTYLFQAGSCSAAPRARWIRWLA